MKGSWGYMPFRYDALASYTYVIFSTSLLPAFPCQIFLAFHFPTD